MPTYEDVPLGKVVISSTRRTTTKGAVESLARSILEIGLQHPIGLTTGYHLIHGRHRYEAYQSLGRDSIPAIIHELDDLKSQLAEIDENLLHRPLTALQESQALKRRKEIYLELHPETKKGAQGGGKDGKGTRVRTESDNMSFSDDTASKTGKNKRTVERAVKLADDISDEVAEQLEGMAIADNKAELGQLAKLSPDDQKLIAADLASGEAKTVKESAKLHGIKPPAPPKKAKPGKKLDKPALYKEWTKAIGPLVRLVDRIGRDVGEPKSKSKEAILGQLEICTEEMAEWMGVSPK